MTDRLRAQVADLIDAARGEGAAVLADELAAALARVDQRARAAEIDAIMRELIAAQNRPVSGMEAESFMFEASRIYRERHGLA